MIRYLFPMLCVVLALALSKNYSRSERDAARSMARLEHAYDLPRLGEARKTLFASLTKGLNGTLLGTQIGLLIAAVVIACLPNNSGAAPLAVVVFAWSGGAIGKAWGSARMIKTTKEDSGKKLTQVVPIWFMALWLLAALLLIVFTVWCWNTQIPSIRKYAVLFAVLVICIGAVTAWWLKRALATTNLGDELPLLWKEALRGEIVRASTVVVPGLVGLGVFFVGSHVASLQPNRTPEDVATLTTMILSGLGFWVVSLLVGWLAVSWHAKQLSLEK
ncbi:MAG: hypothetical protein ACRDAX_09990 [Propionibacteriaceae bacterium]